MISRGTCGTRCHVGEGAHVWHLCRHLWHLCSQEVRSDQSGHLWHQVPRRGGCALVALVQALVALVLRR